jgi:hypothetical protein
MLYTIALVLVLLWLIGIFGGISTGYLIHILLIAAVVVVIIRLVRGN